MKPTASLLLVLLACLPLYSQQKTPDTHYPYGIDVVADCGAVGDGVTDDWQAIQKCIDDHPGKRIVFPKMRNTPCELRGGGGCTGTVDFYVSNTLKLIGNGQTLAGEVPSRWPGGAVEIKFPPSLTKPGIWIPADVFTANIENLFLFGQKCWSSVDIATFDEPVTTTLGASPLSGQGADGILATGGEPSIEGVTAYCFGRHGFALLGDGHEGDTLREASKSNGVSIPSQPDFWSIRNSFAIGNRGYGLYITGADSNAGESIGFKSTGNQLGGIFDNSQLGNTHISPGSHVDGRNAVKAGTTQPVKSISVSDKICTLTTEGPLANKLDVKHTWITVKATSGAAGDGTFHVTAFDKSAHSLTYACKSSAATGGTVGTADSLSVFAVYRESGFPVGSYHGRPGASSSETVWLNPYCENNSSAPDFGHASIVIGRFCEANVTGDRDWFTVGAMPGPLGLGRAGNGLTIDNASDLPNFLSLKAGRTRDQPTAIRLFGMGEKHLWDIGTTGSSFYMRDIQSKTFNSFALNKNGATEISAPGDNPVKLGRGSTGGVQFMGDKVVVAGVDSSGKATFNGGMCQSANVCWTAGKGAPSADTCTRAKGGSLFTRTDGDSPNSLYVCSGETGVWTAK